MPLQALKAAWQVKAGIIPGEARPEFSKVWQYLSSDHAEDQKHTDPGAHAKFSKIRAEAMDYYLQVSMPTLNNWAEIVFIWY
jgi:hypothetical protein